MPDQIWLNFAGVAALLGYSESRVRGYLTRLPSFPSPRITAVGPEWNCQAVNQWMGSAHPVERPVPRARQRGRIETHGLSRHPDYNIWKKMHYRCSNPKSDSYKWYGARGISVCDRWQSFKSFLEDMGPRPTRQHSIDRKDNYRGYEPKNCRWATAAEQYANRRCPRCDHVSHA